MPKSTLVLALCRIELSRFVRLNALLFFYEEGLRMSKSTENIIRLVKAGGNLSVDAEGISTDNILRIVKASIQVGKIITLRNLQDKSTDNLLRVIKAGGENVILEI